MPTWGFCAPAASPPASIRPISSAQVEYLINDSATKVIFAEDEEQLDKMLACRSRCPTLQKIVVFDMEGLSGFSDPMVLSLAEFMALGRNHTQGSEALWEEMIGSRTAGRSRHPRLHLGHHGAAEGRDAFQPQRDASDASRQRSVSVRPTHEERLVFLPLCHVAERIGGYYLSLALGSVMNFAESRKPCRTICARCSRPRSWRCRGSGRNSIPAITIALKDATPFQNWMYRNALAIGNRDDRVQAAGRHAAAVVAARQSAAYWLVFRNIRRMLGLDRCRLAFTGAAPIAPDLIRWYLALGLDMREVYGQTENCGVATLMPPDRIKLGSVGKAAPWGEVAISPQGEILIRGDFLFMGYLNQPEKTAETIDAKGWLHTGDVGSIDNEGFVKITDRMKDIIITSGGKNITPSEIENQLKFSPYVSDAVVIGDKRPYLTCLLMIDQENVEKFAQDHDIPFTNYASLCRAAEIQDLIQREIEAVNANFARVETIKKFYPDRTAADARGRGTDADHEAEAQFREQALRGRDRRHVWRAGGGVSRRTWKRMSSWKTAKDREGPTLRSTRANEEETAMSKSFKALGLAVSALALTQLPAVAQTKVTNEGISATEIVIGTHQDLSGPIKVWGVPVSNGMKMAVEEINAAGGINGRKIKLILEDNGYDPKTRGAGLAEDGRARQDLRHDRPDGVAHRAGRAGHPVRCRRAAAVPADGRRVHLQVRSGQAAGAAEVQQPAALRREHARGGQKYDRGEELQEALHHASGRRIR